MRSRGCDEISALKRKGRHRNLSLSFSKHTHTHTHTHTHMHQVKAMRAQSKKYGTIYGCESWTIKKAEHQRIDAFELWCWRRLLRVPWTARRSNQSILKEMNPEYSLEGLMLKLQ